MIKNRFHNLLKNKVELTLLVVNRVYTELMSSVDLIEMSIYISEAFAKLMSFIYFIDMSLLQNPRLTPGAIHIFRQKFLRAKIFA
ncbi:MAG: hypothetical protein DRR19_11735 [Candidatus Parabeggiatoa sp. nov. 1]|nr:MAG: hypothetical protein DRR19_11735 [Gammaproteobacteria bacterium]